MIALSAGLGLGAALTIAASTLLPARGLHDRLLPGAIWRWPPLLRLTFDDGPDPDRTPRVLDALASFQVRATFFVVGNRAALFPNIVRRIVAEGHELGNHGWDHTSLAFRPRRTIREQLARCQGEIGSITGSAPRFVRPPYGRRDYRFYQEARRLDLTTMFWSLDGGDWLGLGSARLARRVCRAKPGDIVLLHDGNPKARGLIHALETILRHHQQHLQGETLAPAPVLLA